MDLVFHLYVKVLTVLLIHGIVFSNCDLTSKTHNFRIDPFVNGLQRKERQAPIDPSRMYLPPRIDSVASSGFGQIDGLNDFGGNGYGEIPVVQDTFAKGSTAENGNHGALTTAIDGLGGARITGSYGISAPGGSSSDQNSDYNIPAASEGNNLGGRATSGNNNEFNDPILSVTSNYGRSTDVERSTSSNDFATTRTGNPDGKGRNELRLSSSTVQNNNPSSKNDYGEGTEAGRFGHGSGAGGVNQYDASNFGNTDSSTTMSSYRDGPSRDQNLFGQGIDGNLGSSRTGRYSGSGGGGFGNVSPNSLRQTFTSSASGAENSYDQGSVHAVGLSGSAPPNINDQNNSPRTSSQSNNGISDGNHGQNGLPDSRDLRAGEYNKQGSTSQQYERSTDGLNQGRSSSSRSYGGNGFGKSNSKDFDLPQHGRTPFEPKSNDGNNQQFTAINSNRFRGTGGSRDQNSSGGNGGLWSGTTSPNPYDQSSIDGFDRKGSANHENGPNLNTLSGTPSTGTGQNYEQAFTVTNQGSSPNSLNGYNQESSSISLGGSNPVRQNQQLSNNYGQSGPPRPLANGGNGGYNQGERINGPSGVGQNQHGTSTSNGYGQTESQISSSREDYGQSNSVPSINGGYNPGDSLTNGLKDFGPSTPQAGLNNHGSSGSQTLYQPKENYNQNSPTNCGSHNLATLKSDKGSDVNKPNPLIQDNLLTTQFRSYSQGISTFMPERNGYAQIDIPKRGEHDQNSLDPTANKGSSTPGNFGLSLNYGQSSCGSSGMENNEQGSQSNSGNRYKKKHSTLVPKDQYQNSNLPINGEFGKQGTEAYDYSKKNGDFGEPGLNAFSNFAPGNQPNQPSVHQGKNGDISEPSLNAFSKFAPGNQPNQPSVHQGKNGDISEPGLNAFSNFAPSNQQNQLPVIPSNNNCGTNSNQSHNKNKQTEAIFPSSNTGY